MENILLSEKTNYDIEYLLQNIDAFFDTIEVILSKSKDDKNISKLCTKLINIYKEKDIRCTNLIVNCIPYVLKYYFFYFYDDKICPIIEACVLTIYNLSLNDEHSKCNRIRVPNLSIPSVYHNPQISATQSELTESALSKLESEYIILTEQFKPYNTTNTTLNHEKRNLIIKYLLIFYYSKISTLNKQSKWAYCDMCIKACRPIKPVQNVVASSHHHGYHNYHHHHHNQQHIPERIGFYLSSQLLIEMLHVLYYLFYNGFARDSLKAIELISQKADDELLCDVILMSNSIKHTIQFGNNETNDLTGSKNTLINSSPVLMNANKRNSFGTQSASIHTAYSAADATLMNNSFSNQNFNENTNNNNIDDRGDRDGLNNVNESDDILENSFTNVYISPSAEARDAARRASMKLKRQKEQQKIELDRIEPVNEQQEQTQPKQHQNQQQQQQQELKNNFDNIPIIDESSNGESGANDEDEDSDNIKISKVKNYQKENGIH